MGRSTVYTVAKNASWLMVSQLLTWGMALLQTMFLPRYLGAEGIGTFYLAGSLWTIAGAFAGFGMSILLTKEIARKPDRINELFGTSLVLRIVLFLIVIIGVATYAQIAGYTDEITYVIAIMSLNCLFVLVSGCYEAILNGLERMEFISIGTIIVKAIVTVLYILALLRGHGVIVIAWISVLGNLIQLLLMLYFVNKLQRTRISFAPKTASWMLRASFPYFSVYIFLVLYQQIDTVVLSLLANEETIGWYATAKQLLGTLMFIPSVLAIAAFPAMSRMHVDERASAQTFFSKSFDLLMVLAIPIGLGTIVVARPVVVLVFGLDLAQSAPVLMVLGVMLIFTFQNILLGQYYISIDKQRFWTWVMAVATIATIPLDMMLVPWCAQVFDNGAIGGALASAVTELGMFVAGIVCLPRGLLGVHKLWQVTRVASSGILMAVAAWLVRDYFVVIPIVVGAAVYVTSILLFRAIPAEDWALLKQAGQHVMGRLRSRTPQPVSSA